MTGSTMNTKSRTKLRGLKAQVLTCAVATTLVVQSGTHCMCCSLAVCFVPSLVLESISMNL